MLKLNDDLIRQQLAISAKFSELVKDLNIIKMADAGVIDIASLNDEQKEDIIVWIHNDDDNIPPIIKEYIEKCKLCLKNF